MKNFKRTSIAVAAFLLALVFNAAMFGQTADEKLAAADKIYDEARALEKEGTTESRRAAILKFKWASELFRQIGETKMAAQSLDWAGFAAGQIGEKSAALENYNQALAIYRALPDKKLESVTLNNIGKVYFSTGEKQTALDYYSQSLALKKTIGDKGGEAVALNNIGSVYDDLGEKRKALDYYEQALVILKALGDKGGESVALGNLGGVYDAIGDKRKALDYYLQSLTLKKGGSDKEGEAVTLTNLGNFYTTLGENRKALDYHSEALPLFRVVGDKRGEAATLNNIGSVSALLGEHRKALDFSNQALLLQKSIGDKGGEASTLTIIGSLYTMLNDNRKALDYHLQALPLARSVGDKRGEAATLNNIANAYGELGERQKALDFYGQALPLLRATGDKRGEAITLSNTGRTYYFMDDHEKAQQYFQASLPLLKLVGDKAGQANTLNNTMMVWKKQNNLRYAVFYGKQSVNLYQQLRANIASFNKETQQTYLKSIEKTYRRLSDMLVAEGRVAEAEQVLALLKDEELFEYLRRDDKVAADLKTQITLTPTETEALKRYEEIADSITDIGKRYAELEAESRKYPVGKFPRQAEMDALDAQLADARKVFNLFLNELDARFRNRDTKQKDARVAEISGTKALLDELKQPRTVIISTIAGEDRLNLIVTTAKINRAHTVEIKAADLNKLVTEFRAAVKNPLVDPIPLGKKLFDVLFPAALRKDLAGAEADTLVWSLDGTLRYAPLAALWDGEKYLAERYAVAVITLASRDKIVKTPTVRRDWTALGVGVSKEFENFSALTAVPQELCRVVNDPNKAAECRKLNGGANGVIGGVNLRDDEFTLPAFKLHLGRYPIVHIASHFALNAGTESDSFLLLGGGKTVGERKLTLAAVREELDTKFVGTELLTLSACNTAMAAGENSSGAEIEGFGALAQQQGAKSVLATLWAVADDSTRDLMSAFYGELEKNSANGKAEALRLAQIKLINGASEPEQTAERRRSEAVRFGTSANDYPKYVKDEKAPYAHPFYWSPFVLIGNWR